MHIKSILIYNIMKALIVFFFALAIYMVVSAFIQIVNIIF